MSQWLNKIFTQNVLCSITGTEFNRYIKNNNRLIINTSSIEIFNKHKEIQNAVNFYYTNIKKMSVSEILKTMNLLIAKNKKILALTKKEKLQIEETPILLYSYETNNNASNILALGLFRAGFSNILLYNPGNKIKIDIKSVSKKSINRNKTHKKQNNQNKQKKNVDNVNKNHNSYKNK